MVRSSTIINLIKKSCELKKYIKKQTILYTKKNISLFKNLKLFYDKYLQINKKLPGLITTFTVYNKNSS